MKLDKVLAVSSLPGLYKLVTTRSNGLIIEDFDNAKRTFISLRKHQFTPLESVGIYTYADVVEINEIFTKMQNLDEDLPQDLSDAANVHAYFRKVLPEYDETRVYLSDIRKVIKWYGFLLERNLLIQGDDEEE